MSTANFRGGRTKQNASRSGMNVGGDMSVASTVSNTVNNIMASHDEMRLNPAAFEYLLKDKVTAAIEPFERQLEATQADLNRSLQEQSEWEQYAQTLVTDNAELVRRQSKRRLRSGALAVLISLAVLIGVLAGAAFRPSAQVQAAPIAPTPQSTATPAVPTSNQDGSDAAAEAAATYLRAGAEGDVDTMVEFATPDFIATQGGGEKQFRSFWESVQDVEFTVSPGQSPLPDSDKQDTYWVQVVWRFQDAEHPDISRGWFYLQWWRMEPGTPTSGQSPHYRLDHFKRSGREVEATKVWARSRADNFTPG